MKITNSILNKLIKEESKSLYEELSRDILGSVSDYEVEKLLLSYFKKAGMPDDINKLSVLFPILEKCGLKKFVQAYVNVVETSPSEARTILERLKVSLLKVRAELKAGDPNG
jgi:hypothetical protein